ncbi:M48 family metalloprotease [Streptomyces sp. L7]
MILLWLASGALVFHRPHGKRPRAPFAPPALHPTPQQERAKIEPVWREVTARAGVEGRNYELWVEDSDGLNAVAAAGHIVGVTRFALNELPNGELAAVMAHELGHHVGGHAWSGLLRLLVRAAGPDGLAGAEGGLSSSPSMSRAPSAASASPSS